MSNRCYRCGPGGIGNALAREFHDRGLRVVATTRTIEPIKDLADLGIVTLNLEVDQEKSISICIEQVKEQIGEGLDYLVNNAGRSKPINYQAAVGLYSQFPDYTVPALEADFSEMESVFATNFFAVARLCQAFMPLLRHSQGTIVQIGSAAGYIPYAWGSIYNASKAALHSYSAVLRVEIAPLGVHVITVITGGVKSRIARVKRCLNEDSVYKGLEDDYQKRQTHSQKMGMETELYAKEVVRKVLEAEGWLWKTRTIWAGGNAGTVRWLGWILPEIITEWIMSRMFGFINFKEFEARRSGYKISMHGIELPQ